MPCGEGQTGITRDLRKIPEIGPMKANELGRGTCGALDNGPCYPHAVSPRECFFEGKYGRVAPARHIAPITTE